MVLNYVYFSKGGNLGGFVLLVMCLHPFLGCLPKRVAGFGWPMCAGPGDRRSGNDLGRAPGRVKV